MTSFNYCDEQFADVQLLRYRLEAFEKLSLQQKSLIFYLSQATLFGRDITFDIGYVYNDELYFENPHRKGAKKVIYAYQDRRR